MSIQDLGSIGELIAALATLAALIYLAVQVRQNTRAIKSATFHELIFTKKNEIELGAMNAT